MSYLRPTCSDAAARATNISISRFIPAFRQDDAQLDDTTATVDSSAHSGNPDDPLRLPSRRSLDRRWDESRGLVFDRSKTALKNHTWTPTRGIVFSGGVAQRRNYAMRPTRGPAPQDPPMSDSSPKPDQAYGSSLPNLERPAFTTGSGGSKGPRTAKQVQLEKQIDDLTEQVKNLQFNMRASAETIKQMENHHEQQRKRAKEKMEELNDNHKAKEEEFKKARESEYSRGKSDAEKVAKQEAEQVFRDEMQRLRSAWAEMKGRAVNAERRFPTLKLQLEAEIEKKEAEATTEIEARYAQLNLSAERIASRQRRETEETEKIEERRREVLRLEESFAKRKGDRKTYTTYQAQFNLVHEERKVLEEHLKDLQFALDREWQRLKKERRRHEGTQKDFEQVAQQANEDIFASTRSSSEDQIGSMKHQVQKLERIRKDLALVDMEMKPLAHMSRQLTYQLRFRDTTMAAEIRSTALRSLVAAPAKNIMSRMELEIKGLTAQIEKATNATLQQELAGQKRCLIAEFQAVVTYLKLMHLERHIQYFQTLKLEPYIRKAVCMGTIDLRLELDLLRGNETFQQHENKEGVVEARSKKGQFTLASKWRELHGTVDRLEIPIKKRASLLELTGQHHADERELDKQIDAKIAIAEQTLRSQTAKLFASYTEARAKAKRVPSVRVRPSTESTSSFKRAPKVSIKVAKLQERSHAMSEKVRLEQLLSDPKSELDETTRADLQSQYLQAKILLYRHEMNRFRNKVNSSAGADGVSRTTIKKALRAEKKLKELVMELAKMTPTPSPKVDDSAHIEQPPLDSPASTTAIEVPKTTHGRQRFISRRQRKTLIVRRSLRKDEPGSVREANSTASGLKFTPTEPKKAAHDVLARRKFHEGPVWTSSSFLGHQEPGDLAEPWVPSSPEMNERNTPTHSTVSAPNEEQLSPHQDGELNLPPSHDKTAGDGLLERGTEATSPSFTEDDAAKNHAHDPTASDFSRTSSSSFVNTNINEPATTMAEVEEEIVINYEIPQGDLRNALISSKNSPTSFWKYNLYKNAAGETPRCHYCTTYEQTETQLNKFLGEKVVGFDLEWEMASKPGVSSAKRSVSLMQVAAQDRVALFHLAVFRGGDSTEDLIPPSLRAFLEDPGVIKVGVNIGGDATRLRNCFGVQMRGCVELSHWYKLVHFGETAPEKVNRGLVSLSLQVQQVLHLPLAKGDVRTSSWSKRLDGQQVAYAASDAYAGLRLYYELEKRRRAMPSKPPKPSFHELGLPVLLGEGIVVPNKPKRIKLAPAAPIEPTVEPEAAQELDDDEANSEDNDKFFDAAEDFDDPYLDSQDADSPTLPEITYPTLQPLSDSDSDTCTLPSDPLEQPLPSRSPTLPSPEAITADKWARDWHSRLPATYNVQTALPHLRAYHIWHHQGFDLKETAALMRREPLASSTVVTYVAEVLQREGLEYDRERAREVLARLPMAARGRFSKLYLKVTAGA